MTSITACRSFLRRRRESPEDPGLLIKFCKSFFRVTWVQSAPEILLIVI